MTNEVQSGPVAAVDLGSNSFHMVVARHSHGQLVIVDRLRSRGDGHTRKVLDLLDASEAKGTRASPGDTLSVDPMAMPRVDLRCASAQPIST